jgi:hypothetical protein
MKRREVLVAGLGAASSTALGAEAAAAQPRAEAPLPRAMAVPRVQALPQPHDQASIEREGRELLRYHFAPGLRRPFVYPVLGPSGRSLTRMGHPHAPVSHSHHNSVWVAHDSVDGESYWSDRDPGRIVQQYVVEYTDGDDAASIVTISHWLGKDDRLHLIERRGTRMVTLPDDEWLLVTDLQLEASQAPVTLGKTPFGTFAVRMAKTIGVHDGGGQIRNSEGNVDEQGENGCFWKRARWVDYSGPILPRVNEGITFFDHPANPNHPSHFHVRGDGWMGASLTFEGPRTIEPGQLLRLRYGLYVHRGVPTIAAIDRQWRPFAQTKIEDLPNSRK